MDHKAQEQFEPTEVMPMQLRDLNDVLQIERHSFPTPWSRRAFVSELTENSYAFYLVARRGGRVVGYLGSWFVLDEAHITNVAVHPDARGQGVGRLLMEQIIERTESRGCRRITLEVRRSNQIAQNLYSSLGFAFKGVREGYYTDTHEDAFVMVREAPPRSVDGPS